MNTAPWLVTAELQHVLRVLSAIYLEQSMTLADFERLVHRATIFELGVGRSRRRAAVQTKRRRGRTASPRHAG